MGVLTIYLDKCTNLTNKERWGTSDPYCTTTVKMVSKYIGQRDMGQKKSTIHYKNLNPKFDELYEFVINGLDDHQLYISVKDDQGMILKDQFLGKIEMNLWEVKGLQESDGSFVEIAKKLDDGDEGMIYIKLSWKI